LYEVVTQLAVVYQFILEDEKVLANDQLLEDMANAQADGYSIIYIDTEMSIELGDLTNHKIDITPEKFRLIRSNKVEDVNILLTQLINELKEQKLAGFELPKLMIILDSVGQMASNKEIDDLLKNNIKVDFTKSKALGSLFRSINSDLGFLEIPFLATNHSYLTMDMYPVEKLKGGNGLLYSASVIGFMSKSKYKSGEEDDMDLGASGITVTFKTQKSRLARPKKIKFDISFISGLNPYSGLDAFCRPEYYDKIGIAKGKEEVDKSTGEITFKPGGNRWFVKHMGKSVTTKQLFRSDVFTKEVLERMAPIVNDYFRYKSIDELQEVEKEFNNAISDDDGLDYDENGFTDVNADDLF
jgi:hypothetical protein